MLLCHVIFISDTPEGHIVPKAYRAFRHIVPAGHLARDLVNEMRLSARDMPCGQEIPFGYDMPLGRDMPCGREKRYPFTAPPVTPCT